MTPNVDRNLAPETWITAAPQDTLTEKNGSGVPIPIDLGNHTIPVRFHLYWAGADRDGAVAGFYWAVTETTAVPIEGIGIPPLPGPKPQDYHFTTRTDTTFVFNVTENAPDRQHAFFIYAVDNQGKPDATPARFAFIAIDKFPPRPVIEEAIATGPIVDILPDGTPVQRIITRAVTDTFNRATTPTDTVPATSRLDFRWHGEITLAGTYVTGYRYKLDEPQFVSVDSSVHSVSYNTGLPGTSRVSVGTKIFTLRALDQAGGAGQTTRRFIMNFNPDTWWAGPDLGLFPNVTNTPDQGHQVPIANWNTLAGMPGGQFFGPDSLKYRPSQRQPERRTFYEIYQNKLYARTEGDTVHMNSWVVLMNGGYDMDSEYRVKADTLDPYLPPDPLGQNVAIQKAGQVGSPIGFRSLIITRMDPFGVRDVPTQTGTYPIYQPASVYEAPRLAGYNRMIHSGKAFAVAKAEDADGGLDNTVPDPVKLAEAVDQGGGTQEEQIYRRKVLVFYVNKAPVLLRNASDPAPPAVLTKTSNAWALDLRATDPDPYDPEANTNPGGPSSNTIIRFKVWVTGQDTLGNDQSWTYVTGGSPYLNTAGSTTFTLDLGNTQGQPRVIFASGQLTLHIQVCDCATCENSPGQGRCVEYTTLVNYTRPAAGAAEASFNQQRPGPDSSGGR